MLVVCIACATYAFVLNFFYIFFYQFFLAFMSKIQKHIKSWKIKRFDQLCWVFSISKFCLVPLYQWLCASTSIACFSMHSYHCGRNLEIYVTVVNRSSTLSWMISEWFCWSWDMHKLVSIYLPTLYFIVFGKRAYQM